MDRTSGWTGKDLGDTAEGQVWKEEVPAWIEGPSVWKKEATGWTEENLAGQSQSQVAQIEEEEAQGWTKESHSLQR